MKNRAKCKLCSNIIESFHATDYVSCKCDEISVSGGDRMECAAKNWDNFLRVDDQGNEIIIKVKKELPDQLSTIGQESQNEQNTQHNKPSKVELIQMLKEMNENIERLPPYAMNNPINHYDFSSLLILLLALFKDDCNFES